MKLFKTILLILLIGVVVIFALQNMSTVKINFLSWSLKLPISIASIALYVFGALSGGIVFSMLKKITKTESEK